MQSTRIVSADRVAYRYVQPGRGVGPLTLSVEAGECLAVTGPSGCGKSTLARCLTGLIPHLYAGRLDGEVWVDGLRTADTPLWRLSEAAGLVFQNPAAQMLARTVEEEIVFGLENLGLPAAEIASRLEVALLRFGIGPLRERAPLTLSGGEQQRVALAAITARRPPVLVLDEPLSMLDTTAAGELADYLRELAGAGTTLVACEHRLEYLADLPRLRRMDLPPRPMPGRPAGAERPRGDGLPPDAPGRRSIRVRGLTVERGGRTVLRDLDLELRGGEVTAILGRNGVGKTTLLRALAGLQAPAAGAVAAEPGGGRPDLGLVFQNADLQLFNPSVRDEILYRLPGPDLLRFDRLIEALGLSGYEDTPPLLLSEGQKKRVALAAVCMRAPRDGLLLDEPALGQDAAHKAALVRLARDVAAEGRVAAWATHDLGLACLADRLVLLGPCGVLADGPPAAVLADAGAWAAAGLAVPAWALDGGAGR